MLAIFFGRPSGITYYTTNFPQDRSDDNLSDAPGSARQLLPPSNVLASETTDQTYHTAYYQLTIPSFELLEGIFHVDRQFSRSALYGWFSPPPSSMDAGGSKRHTYRHAIRLAEDIRQWYGHLPKGMRVDKEDTAESLSESRPKKQVVQTLGLCIKTWTLMCVFKVSLSTAAELLCLAVWWSIVHICAWIPLRIKSRLNFVVNLHTWFWKLFGLWPLLLFLGCFGRCPTE